MEAADPEEADVAERGNLGDAARDRRRRQVRDFDAMYVGGTPPWDIGRPQAAFRELMDRGGLVGRVLDVGCGTGEHALSTAVAIAQQKAVERGLTARFLTWDALDLAGLEESFDTVVDSGLFHVFDDGDRSAFVAGLHASMPPGGWYHLLCFSDLEPGDWGPRRIRQDEIRSVFREGWRVATIEEATLETTIEPGSVHAWLASIQRV